MKKFHSTLRLFGLTLLLFLSIHICQLSAGETLDIGVLLPLTGQQEDIGLIEKQAFELAAEKLGISIATLYRKMNAQQQDD